MKVVAKLLNGLYVYSLCMECTPFADYKAFPFRPRVFFRDLGCGGSREAELCVPAGFVGCAVGLQSRAIWQEPTGSHAAEPKPSRTVEIHTHTKKRTAGFSMTSLLIVWQPCTSSVVVT